MVPEWQKWPKRRAPSKRLVSSENVPMPVCPNQCSRRVVRLFLEPATLTLTYQHRHQLHESESVFGSALNGIGIGGLWNIWPSQAEAGSCWLKTHTLLDHAYHQSLCPSLSLSHPHTHTPTHKHPPPYCKPCQGGMVFLTVGPSRCSWCELMRPVSPCAPR